MQLCPFLPLLFLASSTALAAMQHLPVRLSSTNQLSSFGHPSLNSGAQHALSKRQLGPDADLSKFKDCSECTTSFMSAQACVKADEAKVDPMFNVPVDSCTCTNAILKQITDCFSCSVAKNGGDRDLYQTGMTGLVQACSSSGFDVSPVTIANSSSTPSTATGTASAASSKSTGWARPSEAAYSYGKKDPAASTAAAASSSSTAAATSAGSRVKAAAFGAGLIGGLVLGCVAALV